MEFDNGVTLDLMYRHPATSFNEKLACQYEQNILSVMEEVYHKEGERIDLVLFLNGLALFAVELKCNTSGQNYEDAINQFKTQRDPNTRPFKFKAGVFAAFAMDLNEVNFCTSLRKSSSSFLPFNIGMPKSPDKPYSIGKGNPHNENGINVSYTWEQIWTKEKIILLIERFAKREPDTVRGLFKTLFDEALPLEQRFSEYTSGVELFVSKMQQEDAGWKSTFQDQHAISVYLTFRYPDKYYIYKYAILKTVAPILGFEAKGDRLTNYREMCDAIRDVAIADMELISTSHDRLGDDCYQDPENRMLAMDIAHFIWRQQQAEEEKQKLAEQPAVFHEFKKWLEAPSRNNGKPYDYKTVKVYLKQIEDEAKKLAPPYDGSINLFIYDTAVAFAPIHETLTGILEGDTAQANGAFPKVLKLYAQFLFEREHPSQIEIVPTVVAQPSHTAYDREKFLEEVIFYSR